MQVSVDAFLVQRHATEERMMRDEESSLHPHVFVAGLPDPWTWLCWFRINVKDTNDWQSDEFQRNGQRNYLASKWRAS